jgi:DNA replication protein DnaC
MAKENCPHCRGTGWRLVARTDGTAGNVAVACECGTRERAEKIMQRARIPKRYEHCDFESYVTELADGKNYSSEQAEALKLLKMTVQKFVAEYPGSDQSGLLLMGNSGIGKTHLAVAALKALIQRGHTGYFCEYGKLLREIQNTYRPDSEVSESGILKPILDAEVLVIDDLGCIKPSDWVRDTIGYILNQRYSEASRDLTQPRCTIITTNFVDSPGSRGQPAKNPGGQSLREIRDDALWERIGERMRSRLFEICRTVEIIPVPDFRRSIRQPRRAGA